VEPGYRFLKTKKRPDLFDKLEITVEAEESKLPQEKGSLEPKKKDKEEDAIQGVLQEALRRANIQVPTPEEMGKMGEGDVILLRAKVAEEIERVNKEKGLALSDLEILNRTEEMLFGPSTNYSPGTYVWRKAREIELRQENADLKPDEIDDLVRRDLFFARSGTAIVEEKKASEQDFRVLAKRKLADGSELQLLKAGNGSFFGRLQNDEGKTVRLTRFDSVDPEMVKKFFPGAEIEEEVFGFVREDKPDQMQRKDKPGSEEEKGSGGGGRGTTARGKPMSNSQTPGKGPSQSATEHQVLGGQTGEVATDVLDHPIPVAGTEWLQTPAVSGTDTVSRTDIESALIGGEKEEARRYRQDLIEVISKSSGQDWDLLDDSELKGGCKIFASKRVAEALSRHFGKNLISVVTDIESIIDGEHVITRHVYMRDQGRNEIIDPTAGQFFKEIPPEYQELFLGGLFVGTPGQLEEVWMDPRTEIRNVGDIDRDEAFRRIWGEQGITLEGKQAEDKSPLWERIAKRETGANPLVGKEEKAQGTRAQELVERIGNPSLSLEERREAIEELRKINSGLAEVLEKQALQAKTVDGEEQRIRQLVEQERVRYREGKLKELEEVREKIAGEIESLKAQKREIEERWPIYAAGGGILRFREDFGDWGVSLFEGEYPRGKAEVVAEIRTKIDERIENLGKKYNDPFNLIERVSNPALSAREKAQALEELRLLDIIDERQKEALGLILEAQLKETSSKRKEARRLGREYVPVSGLGWNKLGRGGQLEVAQTIWAVIPRDIRPEFGYDLDEPPYDKLSIPPGFNQQGRFTGEGLSDDLRDELLPFLEYQIFKKEYPSLAKDIERAARNLGIDTSKMDTSLATFYATLGMGAGATKAIAKVLGQVLEDAVTAAVYTVYGSGLIAGEAVGLTKDFATHPVTKAVAKEVAKVAVVGAAVLGKGAVEASKLGAQGIGGLADVGGETVGVVRKVISGDRFSKLTEWQGQGLIGRAAEAGRIVDAERLLKEAEELVSQGKGGREGIDRARQAVAEAVQEKAEEKVRKEAEKQEVLARIERKREEAGLTETIAGSMRRASGWVGEQLAESGEKRGKEIADYQAQEAAKKAARAEGRRQSRQVPAQRGTERAEPISASELAKGEKAKQEERKGKGKARSEGISPGKVAGEAVKTAAEGAGRIGSAASQVLGERIKERKEAASHLKKAPEYEPSFAVPEELGEPSPIEKAIAEGILRAPGAGEKVRQHMEEEYEEALPVEHAYDRSTRLGDVKTIMETRGKKAAAKSVEERAGRLVAKEGEKPIDIQTSERVERLKEPEVEVLENAQKPQQRRLAKKMPLPSE